MSTKRTKKPADNEVDDLFEGIGDDSAPKKPAASKPKPAASSKPKAGAAGAGKGKPEQDILADLESELEKEPAARPHTPRIKDAAGPGSKRTSTATPPPAAVRRSEDKLPRKSTESTRSFHASFTPSATSSELQDSEKKGPSEQTAPAASSGGGGGWWGGIFATASATANAAIKQAEAAYKEIQKNEEAKKWAEQVRGNVGALRGLGKWLPSSLKPVEFLSSECYHICRPCPLGDLQANMLAIKVTTCDTGHSPPSPTSCTLSHPRSRRTSVS